MGNLRDTLINIIKEQDEELTRFRATDNHYNWWQEEVEKNRQLQGNISRLTNETQRLKKAESIQEDGDKNE